MKTLIVSDSKCDFVDVLESCGAETECIEFQKVFCRQFGDFRIFYVENQQTVLKAG